MVNFQDIIQDPEWDHLERRPWEPAPEEAIPGVRFSGTGLYSPVAGCISSFIVTFTDWPELPAFKAVLVKQDRNYKEIDNTATELHHEVIPGYGYRVLYIVHEEANYKIKMFINDCTVNKRLIFFGTHIYNQRVQESWDYLFRRIQQLTEYYNRVVPPVLKIMNETPEYVGLINNAADTYRNALNATEAAAQSSAGVGIQLLDIINSFQLPAAADQPGGVEPNMPGGGPDGRNGDDRPPRNGPEDGRPQRPRHPPPQRPRHPPPQRPRHPPPQRPQHPPPQRPQHPPPPPPKPKKKSTPSIFTNSVFFTGSTSSLPDLGVVDRASPPECFSEPTFVGFMCNFPTTTTAVSAQVSDERNRPKSHQPITPRTPGLKRKREHFDFDIKAKHIINEVVDVVDQMSQTVDDVAEALLDDPDILDEGNAEPIEEFDVMEEEPVEEAFNLFNDSYAIDPSATSAASPINYSNADDIGRPSKRHRSHSITDLLSPPPLNQNLDSSSDETSWSDLMANLEVARIFMPPSSTSSSNSYVSVRRSFTPPRASTPKPNQRRAGRMTLRTQKRINYKGFF